MCFIEVFGGDVAGARPDKALLSAGGGQVGVKECVRDALAAAIRADGEMAQLRCGTARRKVQQAADPVPVLGA